MTGKSDRGIFQGQGRGTNSKISRGRGRSICKEHLREHLRDTSSRTTSMGLNDQSQFERASSARTIFERAPSERAPSKRALFEGTPSERLEREPSERDAFERVASERASSKRALFEGTPSERLEREPSERVASERASSKIALFDGTPSEIDAFERAPSKRAIPKRALFEGTPSERFETTQSERFETAPSERASSEIGPSGRAPTDGSISASASAASACGSNVSKLLIEPNGNEFFPQDAVKHISETIKSKYEESWLGWSEIAANVKHMWHMSFRSRCRWDPEHEDEIKRIWKLKASTIVRASLADIRRKRSKGSWLPPTVLKAIKTRWETDPDFINMSERNKKNIAANTDGCFHHGGAISISEHKRRLLGK